jgi:3-oxoacyl-[acyl-carrier protein] reductase
MDLGIDGKVALVTASTRGLGFASAAALAAEGCRVTICGRDEERLAEAAAALGGETLAIRADVTEPGAPAMLVERTLERFGRLDILVANAGGPPPARALEVTDEALLAAVGANLLTSVRLVRSALPAMREAGWGRIVCITSVAVVEPIPTLSASNVARTGLWAWATTAAADLAPEGITLNLVCPGLHDTDRVRELGHTGRMGDPADLGRVVAFLCSAHAGFISGAALTVDGAATLGMS